MSTWFDHLLEELQRRQQEQDARREGRPFTRGPRRGPVDGGPPEPGGPRRSPPTRGRTSDYGIPRRWIVGGTIVAVVLVVLAVLGAAAGFITDLMWYGALGRTDVFMTRLWAQVLAFVIGFLAFAVPAIASVLAARRIAPQVPVHRLGAFELPDASRALTIGLIGVALFAALISGAVWRAQWETILLFLNGGSFGVTDPNFGRDVGFYVFGLPFWRFLQGWAVTGLVVIIGLTLGAYAAGAMRWQFRLSAGVRAHVSVLGAFVLAAVAAGYQLDIVELSYSHRGIDGAIQAATYTDLHAQVPAFVILTVVAVAAALILLANIWFRTLWLLVLAVAAWLVLSVVVGGLYPSFVQRISVQPNELALERPYIRQHIAATQRAFELDTIDSQPFTGEQSVSRAVFDANKPTLDNVRLWDYRPLLTTFEQQQKLRQYYQFRDVDIDRYTVGGTERQIMLSAREIDVDGLADAARTWTNERLVFTHGYGITAVPVNAVTPEGQPDYLVSGINREPTLPVGEPRLYFGEGTLPWVVTGTQTDEFDYPLEDRAAGAVTSWHGTTGVSLGNPLTRALFAFRFGDFNLLISGQLTDRSQILFRRSIGDRVREIAPFLAYDRDPYLVSANGRLLWIWDAYTRTDRYPNAQPLGGDVAAFAGANYVRNPVKVVIDAYDGSVRFFTVDPNEPILAAYARIFPTLFEPMSAMPADLVAHLRYPEDLFTAQNNAYLLYHVPATDDGAGTFYNQEDRWAIPTQQTGVDAGAGRPIEPYYVIMKLPSETAGEFVLIQPLVAASRPNMVAWVAARMDPGHYGERISFRFPSQTTTLGPAQIQARINQDSTISAQFTLWSRAGSSVVRGDLLVLPMGDAILYVEPIFLQSTEAPIPEFKRVILASQTRIAFADTLEQGLRQLLGEAALPPPTEEPGGGGTPPSGDAASLIAQAQQLYDQAQAALKSGDLATYQRRIDQIDAILRQLGQLLGTPAPSPAASP